MNEVGSLQIALAVLGVLFTVIAYLLKQKDGQQADQIKSLFEKHDKDAADLADLKLKMAETHYTKSELNDVLGRIEAKVDKVMDALLKGKE